MESAGPRRTRHWRGSRATTARFLVTGLGFEAILRREMMKGWESVGDPMLEEHSPISRLRWRLKQHLFWKALWWDISPSPIVRAHKHHRNRDEVLRSQTCGCFYCLGIYPPSRIEDWVHVGPTSTWAAICPRCGINSVIGSDSGYPVTKEFLAKMRAYWFRELPEK